MQLYFQDKLCNESSDPAIANLKRKGWKECSAMPDYTYTQTVAWNRETHEWDVRDLTETELANAFRDKFPPAKMWQVKVWMTRNGFDVSTVPAILASLPGTDAEKAEALIRWEQVPEVPRDHPLTAFLGAALGLTSEQIDAAWPEILTIS